MSERAMMSDRAGRAAGVARRYRAGRAMAEAMAEARRLLAVTEPEGVHHDILPGLLRYDLQPMRDLAESLAAFVGADDPGAYLATVAR